MARFGQELAGHPSPHGQGLVMAFAFFLCLSPAIELFLPPPMGFHRFFSFSPSSGLPREGGSSQQPNPDPSRPDPSPSPALPGLGGVWVTESGDKGWVLVQGDEGRQMGREEEQGEKERRRMRHTVSKRGDTHTHTLTHGACAHALSCPYRLVHTHTQHNPHTFMCTHTHTHTHRAAMVLGTH